MISKTTSTHITVADRLGEIRITSSASSNDHPMSSSCFGLPKQAAVLTHMQKLST